MSEERRSWAEEPKLLQGEVVRLGFFGQCRYFLGILARCLFVVAFVFGFSFIVWWGATVYTHQEMTRASGFSRIASRLRNSGRSLEAQRLLEIGRVCQNGSGTPLACESLFAEREKTK